MKNSKAGKFVIAFVSVLGFGNRVSAGTLIPFSDFVQISAAPSGGDRIGNGGNVVICYKNGKRDIQNPSLYESVEFFDFYEQNDSLNLEKTFVSNAELAELNGSQPVEQNDAVSLYQTRLLSTAKAIGLKISPSLGNVVLGLVQGYLENLDKYLTDLPFTELNDINSVVKVKNPNRCFLERFALLREEKDLLPGVQRFGIYSPIYQYLTQSEGLSVAEVESRSKVLAGTILHEVLYSLYRFSRPEADSSKMVRALVTILNKKSFYNWNAGKKLKLVYSAGLVPFMKDLVGDPVQTVAGEYKSSMLYFPGDSFDSLNSHEKYESTIREFMETGKLGFLSKKDSMVGMVLSGERLLSGKLVNYKDELLLDMANGRHLVSANDRLLFRFKRKNSSHILLDMNGDQEFENAILVGFDSKMGEGLSVGSFRLYFEAQQSNNFWARVLCANLENISQCENLNVGAFYSSEPNEISQSKNRVLVRNKEQTFWVNLHRRQPLFKDVHPFVMVLNIALRISKANSHEIMVFKGEYRPNWWTKSEDVMPSEAGFVGLEIPLSGIKSKRNPGPEPVVSADFVNTLMIENRANQTVVQGLSDTDYLQKGMPNNEDVSDLSNLLRYELIDRMGTQKTVAIPKDCREIKHVYFWNSQKSELYLRSLQFTWIDVAQEYRDTKKASAFQEYFDILDNHETLHVENTSSNLFKAYSAYAVFGQDGHWLNSALTKRQ